MRQYMRAGITLALVAVLCIGVSQVVLAAGYSFEPNSQNDQCFTCHKDSSLSMNREGEQVSVHVDPEVYNNTPHAQIACIRCHEEIQATPRTSGGDAHPEEVPYGFEARKTISERCAKCHRGVVTESYSQSFHGAALRLGSTTVATCVDCHGAHNVLPKEHPDSTVNKANVPATCGECHPGAGPGIAEGEEHFIPAKAGNPLLGYIWKFFVALIIFDTVMNGPIIGFELIRRLKEDFDVRQAEKGGRAYDA